MAIDRKWYKKSGLKLPSGDVFRIIAVFFDVTITLAVVASKLDNNDTVRNVCYWLFSGGYVVFSSILQVCKTILICVNIRRHTKDTKKKWECCVALLDFIMSVLAIVMGGLYLFGENLPSSLCSEDYCRQLKTGLLGMSLILNLFLTVAENGFGWSGGWDKIKTVDEKHKRWSDLLGLLSVVVLFDQALTGFYMTVYDGKRNSTDITCDVYTHGVSGGTYGLSVILFIMLIVFVVWRRYLIDWCRRKFQGAHDQVNSGGTRDSVNSGSEPSCCGKCCNSDICSCKCNSYRFEEICFIGGTISLVIFFILYVLADLPWPWNCKDQINSQEWRTARLAFLGISFVLVSVHLGLHFFIVLFPSVHAFLQAGRESVVHNSKIKKLFGAQFRNMETKVDEYCVYDLEGIEIKMQGAPKADQTTLSLPLSFQFEHDTEYSLWCQAYSCCVGARQGRDNVEDRVPLTDGDSSETVPLQPVGSTAEPHKLNIGSVLFATPKKKATVLFIEEAYQQEDLERLLAKNGISDITLHSFCDSDQQPKTIPQTSGRT
jgi:hypothetical protein